MTKHIHRRDVLTGLMSSAGMAVAAPALAEAPTRSLIPALRPGNAPARVSPGAERLIAEARLGTQARVGYVVADAQSGAVFEARNPVLALPPASVAKSVTALYALNRLGPGYRFRTRIYAQGTLRNGRLSGNIWLVGGGDPTLNTDVLGDMARDLKTAGIREVTGEFRVQASALPHVHEIDRSQPDHLGYNPAISGLNLNFNRVHFEWKREAGDYAVTMQARAERYRPQVSAARMEIVNRDVPVYTYAQRQGQDRWTVARGALGNGGARWLPVRHPEAYAGEVFRTLARSHGIQLPAARIVTLPPSGDIIVEAQSEALPQILRGMLRHSTNLTAEVAGMMATRAGGRRVTGLRGSGQQMVSWMNDTLGTRRARFVDHSGLGDSSRISASEMVRALVAAGPDGPLYPILKEINLKQESGGDRGREAIDIRAKTGTLNFVSALAGYMRAPGGRDLVFATFTADLPRRSAIRPLDRERPQGARSWSRRSRAMQLKLIERWAAVYGG